MHNSWLRCSRTKEPAVHLRQPRAFERAPYSPIVLEGSQNRQKIALLLGQVLRIGRNEYVIHVHIAVDAQSLAMRQCRRSFRLGMCNLSAQRVRSSAASSLHCNVCILECSARECCGFDYVCVQVGEECWVALPYRHVRELSQQQLRTAVQHLRASSQIAHDVIYWKQWNRV